LFFEKKSEKSLPVRKKGVPLQSRSETSGNFYSPGRKAGVSFLKYFSEFKEGEGRGPERPSGREDRRASLTQKSGK
jgi:hypothetical protein